MRWSPLFLVAATAVCPGSASAAPQSDAAPWFEEVAIEVGLEFRHVRALQPSYRLPEIMSGGACWIDYDRDGDLDLYLVQGGGLALDGVLLDKGRESPSNRLYRNDGSAGFVSVSGSAGTDDRSYGMGCASGDVDGDGWADLYVTNLGPNTLLSNRGDGTFEPVLEGDQAGSSWSVSASFGDIDLDGDLDLFVSNYVDWAPGREVDCFSGGARDYCHPDRYDAPAPDRLLLNRGDGTFHDASTQAGVQRAFGNGLGAMIADLDRDGRPDIYVANDGMPNQLWRNLGDGTFEDTSLLAGTAVNRAGSSEAGMGVQAFDVDADLDLDLFVTHLRGESNTLYVHRGDGQFEDATARLGLGAPSLGSTGFGLGFADFDLDGHADLYVANGRVGRMQGSYERHEVFSEPDTLYRGLGEGRFEVAEPVVAGKNAPVVTSRAAALADYDNDGRVDIAIVANNGPLTLLRNRSESGHHWSVVRVLGATGGDAVGTEVELEWEGGRRLRLIQPGYSYAASNDPRAHFGLGASDSTFTLRVLRPAATPVTYRGLPVDRILVLPALTQAQGYSGP